jgi:hypothetical protein
MRNIQISTEVYAAIWSDRKAGEENEDDILSRRLGVKRPTTNELRDRDMTVTIGYHDPKFGVRIDPGFEIFRTYKRKEYRARAIQGFWVLSTDGIGYPSLNELSNAIGAGTENAWEKWKYIDAATGRERLMSDLRDPTRIKKRGRQATTLADLGLE